MKFRKSIMLLSTLLPLPIIALSCTSKTESTTSTPDKSGDVTPKTTSEQLQNASQNLTLDFEKKNEMTAFEATKTENRSKIQVGNFDKTKFNIEYLSVTENPEESTITVKYKVTLSSGGTLSKEDSKTITGFLKPPISFLIAQKNAIIAELMKEKSVLVVNPKNTDVVIATSSAEVDFANPSTFTKVGKFNLEYFDQIIKQNEEQNKKLKEEAKSSGEVGDVLEGIEQLSSFISFKTFVDIWNGVPNSLENFLNNPLLQLITGQAELFKDFTEEQRKMMIQVPKGINLKDEIIALSKRTRKSLSFKDNTIVISATENPIDFSNSATYKTILTFPDLSKLPELPGAPMLPSPTLTNPDHYKLFFSLIESSNQDLKSIYQDLTTKSKLSNFIIERNGDKDVKIIYINKTKTN